jgi:hypothetical protein
LTGRYCDNLTTVGLATSLSKLHADDEYNTNDYDYVFGYDYIDLAEDYSDFYPDLDATSFAYGLGEPLVPQIRLDQDEHVQGAGAATMSLDVPYENATLFVISKDAFSPASVMMHELGEPGAGRESSCLRQLMDCPRRNVLWPLFALIFSGCTPN